MFCYVHRERNFGVVQQKEYCRGCQEDSKRSNPELHCAIEGHYGCVNKCCQCKCVEDNKERLRLKEAAEEAAAEEREHAYYGYLDTLTEDELAEEQYNDVPAYWHYKANREP